MFRVMNRLLFIQISHLAGVGGNSRIVGSSTGLTNPFFYNIFFVWTLFN